MGLGLGLGIKTPNFDAFVAALAARLAREPAVGARARIRARARGRGRATRRQCHNAARPGR